MNPIWIEIEDQAASVLARWLSEQDIDQNTAFFLANVGHLNRRLALLVTDHEDQEQRQRMDNLLHHPKCLQLLQTILQSLLHSTSRHQDPFLRHLAIFLEPFALIHDEKATVRSLSGQILQSDAYRQYLIELMSSKVEAKHRFFLGTISRLAPSNTDSTLNDLYVEYLLTFDGSTVKTDNEDLQQCTRGILTQLDITACTRHSACLSALVSLFSQASATLNESGTGILLAPLFKLMHTLCLQSRTAACYLSSEAMIDSLLQYVTRHDQNRFDISACLLLGHLVSEQQLNDFRIGYKLTMKLLDLFLYSKYEKNAILASLLSLSIHESIQLIIAQTFQLAQLLPGIDEYPLIYEIIWTLSFHPEIVQQLVVRHSGFLEHLGTLVTVPAAIGICQNVQTKNHSRSLSTGKISSDISLISSPKDRFIVEGIRKQLAERRLRVGPINEASCAVFCISEESKHDCACQAAVRQVLLDCRKLIFCVVQQPHRLDDWLRTLTIQENSLLNIVESGIDRILPVLQKQMGQGPSSPKRTRLVTISNQTSEISLRSTVSPLETISIAATVLPSKKVQTWTNREVLEWCNDHQLTAFSKLLTLYDGRSLLALAHVSRTNAPHSIMNYLRNDCRKQGLRVSFVEFIRFQAALDELTRLEKLRARKQSISTIASRYVYRDKVKILRE